MYRSRGILVIVVGGIATTIAVGAWVRYHVARPLTPAEVWRYRDTYRRA